MQDRVPRGVDPARSSARVEVLPTEPLWMQTNRPGVPAFPEREPADFTTVSLAVYPNFVIFLTCPPSSWQHPDKARVT